MLLRAWMPTWSPTWRSMIEFARWLWVGGDGLSTFHGVSDAEQRLSGMHLSGIHVSGCKDRASHEHPDRQQSSNSGVRAGPFAAAAAAALSGSAALQSGLKDKVVGVGDAEAVGRLPFRARSVAVESAA